jgi:Protein of unknown function (DUF3098)
MSAKKSKKSSSTLDDSLHGESTTNTGASNSGEVSLKEYNKTSPFSFNAKNYKLLLLGLGVNILGFLLMIGGGAPDPSKFDASQLFSTTRITIAPMLIVAGYIIIMYAIMKKPKPEQK